LFIRLSHLVVLGDGSSRLNPPSFDSTTPSAPRRLALGSCFLRTDCDFRNTPGSDFWGKGKHTLRVCGSQGDPERIGEPCSLRGLSRIYGFLSQRWKRCATQNLIRAGLDRICGLTAWLKPCPSTKRASRQPAYLTGPREVQRSFVGSRSRATDSAASG
jgi:hypothetical protein